MPVSPVITVRDVSKTYTIYDDGYARVLGRFGERRATHGRTVQALQGLDLDVPGGECLGLIGSNGSGKTTLLKLLAGTSHPSTGWIELRGRVGCLLELGAGFHRAFSGRENILIGASLLGMSRREAHRKLEDIIAFSELGEFIDAPLRTYSAGMACRLAFSVATAIRPEVLLVDEVLGVGDLHFQEKCAARIIEHKRRGSTIVLASHSLHLIRQICDRALWLKRGRIEACGEPVAVTNAYAAHEEQIPLDVPRPPQTDTAPPKSGSPRIVAAEVVDAAGGSPLATAAPGANVAVRISIENGKPPRRLTVGVSFSRQEGITCFAHSTQLDGLEFDFRRGTATLLLPDLKLLSGTYLVTAHLYDEDGVEKLHEHCVTSNLVVQSATRELGLFRHDHQWSIDEAE